MIVLDTHVVIWWTSSPDLLSPAAAAAIADASEIAIPAIVFWEISVLLRKQRIQLEAPLQAWCDQVLAIPRVKCHALTAHIAIAADQLMMHPDPADRFIVATALAARAKLITKDGPIRALQGVATIW